MPASNSSWQGPPPKPGGGLGVQCSILQSIDSKSALGGLTAAVADEEGNMWVAGNEDLDYSITLRKPQSGEVVDTLQPSEPADSPITCMVVSETSVWAITSAGRALLFNSRTRRQKTTVLVAAEPVAAAASHGGVVYIVTPSSLKLYDGASGQCLRWWSVPSSAASLAVVSSDLIATGHASGLLCHWDSSGTLLRETDAHEGDVTCLTSVATPSRVGQTTPSVISGGSDAVIRIWHDASTPSAELRGHAAPIKGLLCPSTTLLASCSLDGRIVLWDLQALKSVGALDQHGSPLIALAPAQSLVNSVVWSFGKDQSMTVWGLRHGVPEAANFDSLASELTRKDRMLRAAHEELEKLELQARDTRQRNEAALREARAEAVAAAAAAVPPPPHPASPPPPRAPLPDIVAALDTLANAGPPDASPHAAHLTPLQMLMHGSLTPGDLPDEWDISGKRLGSLQAALRDKWAALSLVDDMALEYCYDQGPLENVVRILRDEVDKQSQKVARLTTSTVSHLNGRIEDLMAQLGTKETEIRDVTRALSKSRSKEEALLLEAQNRKAQLDRMSAVQDQLTRDLEKRDSEILQLQDKLRRVTDMTDTQREVETLQAAKAQAEEEACKFQQENAELVLLLDKYRQPAGGAWQRAPPPSQAHPAALPHHEESLPETIARLKSSGLAVEMLRRLTDEIGDAVPPSDPPAETAEDCVRRFERRGELPHLQACLAEAGSASHATAFPQRQQEAERKVQSLQELLNSSDHNLMASMEEADGMRTRMTRLESALREERANYDSLEGRAREREAEVKRLLGELQMARNLASSASSNTTEREEALREAREVQSSLGARAADMEQELAGHLKESSLISRNMRVLCGVVSDLCIGSEVDGTPLLGQSDDVAESRSHSSGSPSPMPGLVVSELLPVVVSQLRLVMASLRNRSGEMEEARRDALSLHRIVEAELKRISPGVAHAELSCESPEKVQNTRAIASITSNMRLLLQAWHRAESDSQKKSSQLEVELGEAKEQMSVMEAEAEDAATQSQAHSQSISLRASSMSGRSLQTPLQRGGEELALLRQALEAKSKEYASLQQELQSNRQRAEEKHKRINSLQEMMEERSRMLQEERHRSYQLQRELQHIKAQLRDRPRRASEKERDAILEERLAEAEDELSRGHSRAEDRVAALQEKLAGVEETLQEVHHQNSLELKQKTEGLEQRLTEAQEQVKLQQVLLASQKEDDDECDSLRQKVSRLEGEMRDTENSLAQARELYAREERHSAELQRRYDAMAKELLELQRKYDDLRQRHDSIPSSRGSTPASAPSEKAGVGSNPLPRRFPTGGGGGGGKARTERSVSSAASSGAPPQRSETEPWPPATPAGFDRSRISTSAISMSPPDPRPDLSVNMQSLGGGGGAERRGGESAPKQRLPPGAGVQQVQVPVQRGGQGGGAAPPPQYFFPPRSDAAPQQPQTSEQRVLSPVEQRRVQMGLMKQHGGGGGLQQKQQAFGKAGGGSPRVPVVVAASIPSPEKERRARRGPASNASPAMTTSPSTSSLSSSGLLLSGTSSPRTNTSREGFRRGSSGSSSVHTQPLPMSRTARR